MSSAKVIADSITKAGHRFTTLEVKLPTVCLHRLVAYRSLTVSPVYDPRTLEETIHACDRDPYVPHISGGPAQVAEKKRQWELAKSAALSAASLMVGICPNLGLHTIGSYTWSKATVSGGDWRYLLRACDGEDAEIAIIAQAVANVLKLSKPTLIRAGIWHLPFIYPADAISPTGGTSLISASRVSRCSQLSLDGRRSTSTDREEGAKLWAANRLDLFEHQVTPSRAGTRHTGWATYRELNDDRRPQ